MSDLYIITINYLQIITFFKTALQQVNTTPITRTHMALSCESACRWAKLKRVISCIRYY